MPIFDPLLPGLNIPHISALVQRGDVAAAFRAISVRGARHKIKSLFLRDMAIATDARTQDWTLENHFMYCQPVDLWVRVTMACIGRLVSRQLPALPKYEGLHREDAEGAALLILLSKEARVSPLHANHGIWYFARHAVEDQGRLESLLQNCDLVELNRELELMGKFVNEF